MSPIFVDRYNNRPALYLENEANGKRVDIVLGNNFAVSVTENGNEKYIQTYNPTTGIFNFDQIEDVTIKNKSVLKEGDHGVGAATQNNTTGIDIDSFNFRTGFYSGNNWAAKSTKLPFGTTASNDWFYLLNQNLASNGSNYKLQILGSAGNKQLAFRNIINGVPQPFQEFITTTNVNNYLPIGIPQPWPTATPPSGWLKCNGATFEKARYPKLAIAYPTGKLPDLRGEFIRGYDDERGIDSGRTILSGQGDAIRNITGTIGTDDMPYVLDTLSGTFYRKTGWHYDADSKGSKATGDGYPGNIVGFDASKVVPTATENRPRNIAFLYIVKAE